MFDPNYNKYRNVYMDQDIPSAVDDDYFGHNLQNPYIRGVTTHMPSPMPGNVMESSLYPLQSSLATPQFNTSLEQSPQGYAEGGMIEEPKKRKKKESPYPSLAEMIRQQGKGEDTILAHINPLEAAMLREMGGSGTINPITGLPQFGFLKRVGNAFKNAAMLPIRPFQMITPQKRHATAPVAQAAPAATSQAMVPYSNPTATSRSQAIVPAAPVKQMSTNEQMLQRLQNQTYADQARLTGSNYAPYRGEIVASPSATTSRAQALKDQWAAKPTPYSKKIETVLKRDGQGFSADQQQNLLNMIRRGATPENLAAQRLGKQFGNNYGYAPEREAEFKRHVGTDAERGLANSRNNLKNLSDELALLENRRGVNTVNAFRGAGLAKEGRRNALTNQLEEFGNQERNFKNLKIQANRDSFNEAQMAPQRKINAANQAMYAIAPYVGESHPTRAALINSQLQKATNFYNNPYLDYPGQRVVDINPQTQMGYRNTLQFDPKYRDAFHNERKTLERGFLNNPNLATQTYNRTQEAAEPLMANLDYLTKQQMKNDAREVSGRHRRMGTYGSGVHKAETEKALRNVLRRVQTEREGALLGVSKNQAGLANEAEQNNFRRYGQLVGQGAKEFSDTLGTHRNLVNSGNRQWAMNQEAENARLQSWYDQLNRESPALENSKQPVNKYLMSV